MSEIRQIPLGGQLGGFVNVSAEDYDELIKYYWYQSFWYNLKGELVPDYILGRVGDRSWALHRFLMNAKPGEIVDHINHNVFDCYRKNLRFTTAGQNAENRSISKNKKSSKYHGVFYNKQKNNKKYFVQFITDKTQYCLGCYETQEEAAEVYDMFMVHEKKYWRELNFPEKADEYCIREYIPYKSLKDRKTSKYIGVHRHTNTDIFISRITDNNERIILLNSKDELECAKAYDSYIVNNYIKDRKLNFPEDYPDYNSKTIRTNYITIDKNTIRLLIGNEDEIVLIDRKDYNLVKYYTCYIDRAHSKLYVYIQPERTITGLHRFLLNVTDPSVFVDHLNGNGLDNRKKNIVPSDASRNSRNRGKSTGKTSKYLGVSFAKDRSKWVPKYTYKGSSKHLPGYIDEEYAARRRDLEILKDHHDCSYKLNFRWTKELVTYWCKILKLVEFDLKLPEYFHCLEDDQPEISKANSPPLC